MKKRTRKSAIALLLIFSMLLAQLPGMAWAAEDTKASIAQTPTAEAAAASAAPAVDPMELAKDSSILKYVDAEVFRSGNHIARLNAEETLSSYAFLNSDGTKTVYYLAEEVKYVDASGKIREKDLTLTSTVGGYTTTANDVQLTLPTNPSSGIGLTYGNYHMSLIPQDGTLRSSPVLANNAVTYPDYFGEGMDLVYTPTGSGFKEDIVLDAYTGVNSFTFTLNTRGLNLYQANGRYFLAPGKGSELRFELGDIVSFDAKGRFSIGTVTAETLSAGNLYRLTIAMDEEFLTDENTTYPVSIDSTTKISDNTHGPGTIIDASIYQNAPSVNSGGWTYLHSGYYDSSYGVARTAFNLPGLLFNTTISGSDVISAVFYVREATGSAGIAVNLHVINSYWTEGGITWNSHGNSYSSYVQATAYPSYNNFASYSITSLVKDWLNADLPEYGFMLVSSNETSIDKAFFSSEYGTADNRPYVAVTHTDGQVDPPIPPEPIPDPALNHDQIDVDVGSTAILSVENLSANASITWSSSDSSVATVSSNGVVVGRQAGTATITANISGYGSLYCTVYVIIPDGIYYIKNRETQFFVDIENFTTAQTIVGANIVQMPSTGGVSQKWLFTYLGSGVYSITLANVTTPFYLGMLDDSGNDFVPAVIKTGVLDDAVKWKLAPASGSSYKLIPVSGEENGLWLAMESGYEEYPAGCMLRQMDCAGHDNFIYEWDIIPTGNAAYLLGIEDVGQGYLTNHDHSSVFCKITDELQLLGFGSFNINVTTSTSAYTVQNALQSSRVFVFRGHGGATSDDTFIELDANGAVTFRTSHIYNYGNNNHAILDLSNCKLVLFVGCNTATTTGKSLPDAAVAAGAEYSIGFTEEIDCAKASEWTEYFLQYCTIMHVEEAAESAAAKCLFWGNVGSSRVVF